MVADVGQHAVACCEVFAQEILGTVLNTKSVARWRFDVYFGKGAVRPEATKTLKVDVK